MDNVTHALLGVSLIGLRSHTPQQSRGLWLGVMLASQAPDFDLLPGLFNAQAKVAFHRGASHSWVGLAIIVGLVTLSVGALEPGIARKKLALWSSAAVFVHLLFDAFTCYGTRVLLPYTDKPIAMDILFIVDIPIILVLGISAFYYLYRGKPQAMRAGLIVVLIYVLTRGMVHNNLVHTVERQVGTNKFSVLPLLNPVGNWLVIVDKGEAYSLGEIGPAGGKLALKANYNKNLSNPLVKRIIDHPVVDSFLDIARFPYAQVVKHGDGWQVKIADLRQWPYGGFNALISLNHDLQVQTIRLSTWN